MKLRKILATTSLSVALLMGVSVQSASAAPVITGTVPTGVDASATADVPISLSGVDWESVLVTIDVETGGLTIDLTGDTAESAGYDLTDATAATQSFYGTFASVNAVLNSGVTWHAPSSVGPTTFTSR